MVVYREARGRAWRRRWFPPRMHRPSRESSRATGTLGKTCPVPPTPRGSASPLHDSVDLVALAEPLLLEGRFLSGSRYGEGHQDPERRALRIIPTRDGQGFHRDANGDVWRTYPFVEGTVNAQQVDEPSQAFAAAAARSTKPLVLATGPRAGGALCASWAEGRITASESPKQPQGGPAKAQTTSLRGRGVRICLSLGLLRRAETL